MKPMLFSGIFAAFMLAVLPAQAQTYPNQGGKPAGTSGSEQVVDHSTIDTCDGNNTPRVTVIHETWVNIQEGCRSKPNTLGILHGTATTRR